ncbi:threonine-phosphate decarboxylase, partial [Fournierella massiliensis]|nr:threonine-phosphate decarboxylase [Fournierella massiliensis]
MYTKHGGDWAGYLAEYGRPALDFSANLSPLGMPRPVALAARRALKQSEAYPDPLCRALTGAIAAREGVPGEWVLCGG